MEKQFPLTASLETQNCSKREGRREFLKQTAACIGGSTLAAAALLLSTKGCPRESAETDMSTLRSLVEGFPGQEHPEELEGAGEVKMDYYEGSKQCVIRLQCDPLSGAELRCVRDLPVEKLQYTERWQWNVADILRSLRARYPQYGDPRTAYFDTVSVKEERDRTRSLILAARAAHGNIRRLEERLQTCAPEERAAVIREIRQIGQSAAMRDFYHKLGPIADFCLDGEEWEIRSTQSVPLTLNRIAGDGVTFPLLFNSCRHDTRGAVKEWNERNSGKHPSLSIVDITPKEIMNREQSRDTEAPNILSSAQHGGILSQTRSLSFWLALVSDVNDTTFIRA